MASFCSVAISGDTIVIGVDQGDQPNVQEAGLVHVFNRRGARWFQRAVLGSSDAASSDWFGFSVAISGDTVVVGAPLDDHSGVEYAGSAYVFTVPTGRSAWPR